MRHRTKLLIWVIIIIGITQLIILALLYYFNYSGTVDRAKLGVTFSPAQARYFGLDPKTVLIDSLDDLKIKNYRLSAYWNVIERTRDEFDFSELDWQIKEIEKRGGNIILAVGRRLPRWPECHDPRWIKGLSEKQAQNEVLDLVAQTIKRYKNKAAIIAWQIENEPFLAVFGECPKLDAAFYEKEIKLARSLDSRPLIVTESGELSAWLPAAFLADKVGVSLYRIVWNKIWGAFYYPLTPAFYRFRAQAVRALGKPIFVSELQAEPWERGVPLPQAPILEQKKIIDGKKIRDSVDFAKKAGFDEIYFWGVEWWAWLKSHGDDDIWNAVKQEVRDN